MPTAEVPLVSVVMPVLNEAGHLQRSFQAIDAQTYPRARMQILVVDGGSSDDTMDLVRARVATDDRVQLLGGSGVNTPTAMNLGVEASTGPFVAKVDGHGWINETFIEDAVRVLEAEPSVACVGGEIVPVASTTIEHAIKIARFSTLGVGGGIYTAEPIRHDVDTVQCGVYRRTVLDAIGGFDPELQFGEDEEVNYRVRLGGWRIVFEPSMRFNYRVRPSLRALFRQYRNYGRARVAVVRKHPSFLRLKHTVPALIVIALVGALAAGLSWPPVPIVVIGTYLAALLIASLALSVRRGSRRPDMVAAALACLHLGYGIGTLRGLGSLLLPRR